MWIYRIPRKPSGAIIEHNKQHLSTTEPATTLQLPSSKAWCDPSLSLSFVPRRTSGFVWNMLAFTYTVFYSRGQHLCEFIETKEGVSITKELNSHKIFLENQRHQHGRRSIVLGHQYGRHGVMWRRSMDWRCAIIWALMYDRFLGMRPKS